MRVIEKPWRFGTYLAYADVEEDLIPTTIGMRVLPAPFYYEKKLYFELFRRYEPGDNPTFPNGGYEVRDMTGGIRAYDFDQLIIHPTILHQRKLTEKLVKRAEKNEKRRERIQKKNLRENKVSSGKRGRPALSAEEKAQREMSKKEAGVRSGGRRGRPKSTEPKVVVAKVGGGKRGRPPLSDEAKAAKELAAIQLKMRSGGKRGRPSKRK